MKQLIPILFVTIICGAAYTESNKSDVVAIYNLDSVQHGNQRCIKDQEKAQQQLETSRSQTPNEKEADKRTQEVIKGTNKVQEEIKSKTKSNSAKDLADPKRRQKQITKDSIFLHDSIPVKCQRRVVNIAEDYRKTFGYKNIMTKEEFATYKMTSIGAGSKSETVTKMLINYANQDSVAAKY